MPTDLYVAVESSSPTYHVVPLGKTEAKCAVDWPMGIKKIHFPRIDPAEAQKHYDICVECETPIEVEEESIESVEAADPGPAPISNPLHDWLVRAASGYRRYQRDRLMAVQGYLEGGAALIEARKLAAHGEWISLLEEFDIPRQTAHRMMRLADRFGEDANAIVEAGGISTAYESVRPESQMSHGGTFEHEESEDSVAEDQVTPMASTEEMVDVLDDLHSENHDLRKENLSLRKGASESTDVDKPPTPNQKLKAQIDLLAMEVQQLTLINDEKDDELRFHRGNLSDQESERHQAYSSLQVQLSSVRSQVNEYMAKYNEELRSRQYWEQWSKANGWTNDQVK